MLTVLAPVFGYEPVDETSHLLQLRNETRVDVEAKLLDAGLSRQQRSQLKKILAEGALPFHDDDIRASLSTVQVCCSRIFPSCILFLCHVLTYSYLRASSRAIRDETLGLLRLY